jgi:hypothetical protein
MSSPTLQPVRGNHPTGSRRPIDSSMETPTLPPRRTASSTSSQPRTNDSSAASKINRLAPADEQKIASFSSRLRIPLNSLEDLRRTNVELRERIAEIDSVPPPTLLGRFMSWGRSMVGLTDNSPSRQELERELAANIKQIKLFTERVIQPKVDKIRQRFEGKTFTRTEHTARPLVLAGVPSEKVGKIPAHATLLSTLADHVENLNSPCVRVTAAYADESLTITRVLKSGEKETLRISYRRPGKVDVEMSGPNGMQLGSFWNDDALKLGKHFAAGRNLTIKPTQFKDYTIV